MTFALSEDRLNVWNISFLCLVGGWISALELSKAIESGHHKLPFFSLLFNPGFLGMVAAPTAMLLVSAFIGWCIAWMLKPMRNLASVVGLLFAVVFFFVNLSGSGLLQRGQEVKSIHNQVGNPIPEDNLDDAIRVHGFQNILLIAEGGNRKAQSFVAGAYAMGVGIPKNIEAASSWALRAANQGEPNAQYLIGLIHADAIPEADLLSISGHQARAYMWLNIAAAQGHNDAARIRDMIRKNMSPETVQRAQSMSLAWKACNSPSCWNLEPKLPVHPNCAVNAQSVLCFER